MRILHLPGLYFGTADREEEEITVQNYYLDTLLQGLEGITKKYSVDYIFITSDMTQDALLENKRDLAYYLNKISAVCGESLQRIYLCPGMYDVDCGEETDICLFYLYEIEEEGMSETYISTTYKFDGKNWSKQWKRIYLGAMDKKKKIKLPHRRLSVMWWIKNL